MGAVGVVGVECQGTDYNWKGEQVGRRLDRLAAVLGRSWVAEVELLLHTLLVVADLDNMGMTY